MEKAIQNYLNCISAIGLPSKPFLGCHFGFHIFFSQWFSCGLHTFFYNWITYNALTIFEHCRTFSHSSMLTKCTNSEALFVTHDYNHITVIIILGYQKRHQSNPCNIRSNIYGLIPASAQSNSKVHIYTKNVKRF